MMTKKLPQSKLYADVMFPSRCFESLTAIIAATRSFLNPEPRTISAIRSNQPAFHESGVIQYARLQIALSQWMDVQHHKWEELSS